MGLFAPCVPGRALGGGEGSIPDSHRGHGSGRAELCSCRLVHIIAAQCSCSAPRRELRNKFIKKKPSSANSSRMRNPRMPSLCTTGMLPPAPVLADPTVPLSHVLVMGKRWEVRK